MDFILQSIARGGKYIVLVDDALVPFKMHRLSDGVETKHYRYCGGGILISINSNMSSHSIKLQLPLINYDEKIYVTAHL